MTRVYWALQHEVNGDILHAVGCWHAPWIFPTRNEARKAAHECQANGIPCRPVRIRLQVRVWLYESGVEVFV